MAKAAEPSKYRDAVWAAIDEIARRKGTTLYRLAQMTGRSVNSLYPATRRGHPGTRLIGDLLSSTGISWAQFGEMVDDALHTQAKEN